jgi:hypothetical protein
MTIDPKLADHAVDACCAIGIVAIALGGTLTRDAALSLTTIALGKRIIGKR